MREWLLVIGSNMDGEAQLGRAILRLQALGEVQTLGPPVTTVAEPPGAPDYCNVLVSIRTEVADLPTLDAALKAIESALGRDRRQRDLIALDIDVLALGGAGRWRLTGPARRKRDFAKAYVCTLLQTAGISVSQGPTPSH
jgi:2-amino-4-hydroxy-6-hydroxymethyldihydropteridine diphosphokinase